jgi:hypothetical protein
VIKSKELEIQLADAKTEQQKELLRSEEVKVMG